MAGREPRAPLSSLILDESSLFKPLSGAPLGLDEPPAESTPLPRCAFDIAPEHRYSEGGLLGRGGMGEIRAAFDARLQRTSALKTPLSQDSSSEARLVEEAIITARLAHPGIVPIYDAGRTRSGKPFYTMPVLEGQSLEAALEGAGLPERLRLVPRLLSACQAVAYAHSQGMVHRDLKPANILVGPYGETRVADWGLAAPLGATSLGRAGTPGYAAPELDSDLPLAPTADVYALGQTLLQLCTGCAPGSSARPGPEVTRAIPPELLAIGGRATRPRPEERYPDAAYLAQDLEAWFEGRRVSAHRYTVAELVRRIWQQHRLTLSIGLLALTVMAVAGVMASHQTALEHARTRRAERSAVDALKRSDQNLALAELAQAFEAIGRDAWADAELLAASSLFLSESPEGRGVLTRLDARARPRLIQQWLLPPCVRTGLSFRGSTFLCSSEDTVTVTSPEGPEQTLIVPHQQAILIGEGDAILTDSAGVMVELTWLSGNLPRVSLGTHSVARLSASAHPRTATWLGGNQEHWADLETGEVSTTVWCNQTAKSIPAVSSISPLGWRVAICQNGTVYVSRDGSTPESPLMALGTERGTPQTLTFSVSDGRMAALGMANGSAGVLDLEAGTTVNWFSRRSGALHDMALAGNRLAISDGKRTVQVLDVDSGVLLTQLSARQGRVAWRDNEGTILRVAGETLSDWQMPDQPPWPHLRAGESGISALSLSPNGQLLASAHGDGTVRLWSMTGSQPLAALALHWSVAKDVEFSPDGQVLAVVCAQSEVLYRVHLPPLQTGPNGPSFIQPPDVEQIPAMSGRRVAWLKGDLLLLSTYRGGWLAWRRGTPVPPPLPLGSLSVPEQETDPSRDGLTFLGSDGWVQRLDASSKLSGWQREATTATGVAGDRHQILIVHELELERIGRSGESQRALLPEGMATEVAVDPRGRWAAVGHLDGSISLWALPELERRAVLKGHEGRVAALAFHPSGDWLFSGAWDGDLRAWSLHPLETAASALLADATATWGRTVEDVLRERSGRLE